MIVKHTAAGFVSDLYEDCGRDVLAGNGIWVATLLHMNKRPSRVR